MNTLMEIDGAVAPTTIHQSLVTTHDAFAIPPDDLPEFLALPQAVRASVHKWLSICQQITNSPKVRPACKRIAAMMQGLRGCSARRIATRYYEYMRASDWHVLVDWAKAGPAARGDTNAALPPDFVPFWKALREDFKRNGGDKAAWRELKHIYRFRCSSARQGKITEYKTIPGYGRDWPAADETTGFPRGWSYSNLSRPQYSPDLWEKKVARIGKSAAAHLGKQVHTSRIDPSTGKSLAFGQFIMFDDQEYDLKTNFLSRAGSANRKAMRPLGFNALELLSASCFAQSFKPTIWDDATDGKRKLTERDFLWFVVHVLTTFGYRNDQIGTKLILELGTAAIRNKQIISRLESITNGRVTIDTSGVDTSPAFAGLFESAAKGNFKFKAALESFFNLVRNEFAMLPGATGKDRDHCPAELHGRDRYNDKLLKLAAALPAERAALLKYPFLEWNQFIGLALDIYRIIDERTDHELEGWKKLGFIANEWRLSVDSQHWLPMQQFLALPAPQQSVMRTMVDHTPGLTRARQLSPREVFHQQRVAAPMAKLPEFMILDLLGDDVDQTQVCERTVKGRYIEFDDRDLDPDPLRFDATLDGRRLRHGQTYLTLINPFNPTQLHLFNASRAYIGAIPRDFAPCRSDLDAVRRKMGEVRKDENERLVELGLRHIDKAREKTEMHEHNHAVASGYESIDQLRKDQREQKSLAADARTSLLKNARTYKPEETNECIDQQP
jgi:hypothetical protein